MNYIRNKIKFWKLFIKEFKKNLKEYYKNNKKDCILACISAGISLFRFSSYMKNRNNNKRIAELRKEGKIFTNPNTKETILVSMNNRNELQVTTINDREDR